MMDWDKIQDKARSFMESRIILTAAELNLFTQIGDEMLSAHDLAQRINLDLRATRVLLDALTSLGLLDKQNDYYRNTPATARYLNLNNPENGLGYIRHQANLWESWSHLTEVVHSGKPFERIRSEDSGRDFILAMHQGGWDRAQTLAHKINLTGLHRMLDMGGGPGSYSIAFCEKEPGLHATIYDMPYALEVAKEVVAEHGLSDRVDLVAGDFLKDPVPGGYDLVLISNILHSYGDADCRRIVRTAADSLIPGGRLVISDFLMEPDRVHPEWAAIFSINMLVGTPEGRSYTAEEVRQLMWDNGIGSIQYVHVVEAVSALVGTREP